MIHTPMQKAHKGTAPGSIPVSKLERALYDALKHRYQWKERELQKSKNMPK